MDTEPEDTLGERLTRVERDIVHIWIALGRSPLEAEEEAPLWVGTMRAIGVFLGSIAAVLGPTVGLILYTKSV